MEDLEQTKLMQEWTDEYIKLHFKGWEYSAAVSFVEGLLKRLKKTQKETDNPVIKGLFDK
ncbi:MAG TPA: hypothetical protein VK783_13650 [Bacteroidia bacterium]|jgi:hypothetical protein|nr:hypothetical protein [Bacteroidia bacterium]